MMKRKLAAVLSGTAILGTLAFVPVASAYDEPVVERSVRSGPDSSSVTIENVAPGSQILVLKPGETLAMAPQSSPNESPIRYDFATARQPGSVPTPYGDLPGSGHVGDEFYNKQFGGVPGS